MDGSTSTNPLRVLVQCKMLGIQCSWHPYQLPREIVVPPAYAQVVQDAVPDNGTHEAYLRLIKSQTDLILVARSPSESELALAQEQGVVLEVKPIALDAFVFLANDQNPIDNLTVRNVRDIYAGKVKDWAGLGGKAGVIHAYQREEDSGSQELMETLVMKGTPLVVAPEMIRMSMTGPINAIRDDPLGIGYSVYYYVTTMFPSSHVKLLAIDGVKPVTDTIVSHAYPLTTEVLAVVQAGMSNESPAFALRDWLETGAGQSLIRDSGYIPLATPSQPR